MALDDRDDRGPELSSAIEPESPPSAPMVVEEVEALPDSAGMIRSGKLAGKSMRAAIWILAVPVLVQQTMAACLGLVDKIIAGSLPADIVVAALDGIGVAAYIGWFIGIAMTGLGIGGQAIIARAMGAGDRDEAHRALGQSMTLSVAWGLLVGLVLWALAPGLARLCGLSEGGTVYFVQYVRTLACGMPACGVMMVGSMCLHGAGETAMPSIVSVVVNVVNIVLSWALSGADVRIGSSRLHNPMPFDLDVVGIALGTALSYVVGAVLVLMILRRGVEGLRLDAPELAPDRPMIGRMIRIGVPNFLEGISMWVANLFVLQFIGQIARRAGASAPIEGLQGAHIIAGQWEAFSFLPGFAMGTAAGALAGQYLGAGNPAMAKRCIVACTGIACVIMGAMGAAFILLGPELTSVISDEPVHLATVPRLLVIGGAVQAFFAVAMVIRQGLRGVGDTRWTFLITSASSYGIRLPAAWLLGVHLGYGLEGLWIGLCGELVIRSGLFAARFINGGWMRVRV